MAERLPKANTQFDKVTDTQLETYAQAIYAGLNSVAGLAMYPTPPVLPAALLILINNYSAALAAAADGGELAVTAKDNSKNVLQSALRQNARYVTQVAQSTLGTYASMRADIAISGYVVSLDPTPINVLPAPEVDEVMSKGIGQLNVRLIPVPGAKGYLMKYKKSTESAFSVHASTTSRFILTGLDSANVYNVNFTAIGTRNTVVTESPTLNYVIL